MKTWIRVTSVVLTAVLLAGCRARHRVVIPTEGPPRLDTSAVQPGDDVRVKLQSGETLYFEVAEVRPDALLSTRGLEVRFDAMARLDRSKFSPMRTVLLVGGALAALVMAVTAAAYASFTPG